MKVLVTGATGFLGSNLTRRLLASGDRVRVLARSASRAEPLVKAGAELAVGDVTDAEAVLDALRDVEIVYHLAGRLLAPGIPIGEYYRTHVEGTRVLLDCCHRKRVPRRLVHCSTTGVLGATGDRPADEGAPVRPGNEYEATKWQAELLVRQEIARGFPAVIARPGLVYGPGDLHLLGFFHSVRRGFFRPIGRRTVWLHPIYVDDMSEAFVTCGQHPRADGECFNIAAKPVSLADLAATIATALGAARPRGTIPTVVAQIAAAVGDRLPETLKARWPMTSSRLLFLTHSRVYNVSRAARVLGFEASTDLAVGMARTVAWYRDHGHLPMATRQAVPPDDLQPGANYTS